MSQIIGRWAYTVRASKAEEMIRDLSGDAELVAAPGDIRRIPGGKGWRITEDGGGYTCLVEYSAAECDALAVTHADSWAKQKADEERWREYSRQSRELWATPQDGAHR